MQTRGLLPVVCAEPDALATESAGAKRKKGLTKMVKNKWKYTRTPSFWRRADGIEVHPCVGRLAGSWLIYSYNMGYILYSKAFDLAQSAMSAADKEIPIGERNRSWV